MWVSTTCPSVRVIKPKSLLLLFPNRPLRHTASLCDESVGTKRQHLVLFHLSLPLLRSLVLSVSVFPRRNNWHSSPSRGKKLIYILPHKHKLALGLSTQTPKTAEESSPTSSFPENPPSLLLQLSAAGHQPLLLWERNNISSNTPPPTPPIKCILGSVPAGRGSWRSLIARHGPLLFFTHAAAEEASQMTSLKGGILPVQGQKSSIFRAYYFYTVKSADMKKRLAANLMQTTAMFISHSFYMYMS